RAAQRDPRTQTLSSAYRSMQSGDIIVSRMSPFRVVVVLERLSGSPGRIITQHLKRIPTKLDLTIPFEGQINVRHIVERTLDAARAGEYAINLGLCHRESADGFGVEP